MPPTPSFRAGMVDAAGRLSLLGVEAPRRAEAAGCRRPRSEEAGRHTKCRPAVLQAEKRQPPYRFFSYCPNSSANNPGTSFMRSGVST